MPKPYIGPKVQVHVYETDYNVLIEEMERRGWGKADYPDMLREVFRAGVAAVSVGAPRGEE